MVDPADPRTTGGLQAPESYRAKLAKESFLANKRNEEFVKVFPQFLRDDLFYPGHVRPIAFFGYLSNRKNQN